MPPPPWTSFPPSSPFHPTRLSQHTGFGFPVSSRKFPLFIYFIYGNICFNAILSNHPTLSFSESKSPKVCSLCLCLVSQQQKKKKERKRSICELMNWHGSHLRRGVDWSLPGESQKRSGTLLNPSLASTWFVRSQVVPGSKYLPETFLSSGSQSRDLSAWALNAQTWG